VPPCIRLLGGPRLASTAEAPTGREAGAPSAPVSPTP